MFNRLKIWQLKAALQSKSARKRRDAATALGNIADSRAVELLLELLKDTDKNVCAAAEVSLAKQGRLTAQHIGSLVKSLSQIANPVAEQVFSATCRILIRLDQLGDSGAVQTVLDELWPVLLAKDAGTSNLVERLFLALGSSAVGSVVTTLQETRSPTEYCEAARILGEFAARLDSKAVEALLAELKKMAASKKYHDERPHAGKAVLDALWSVIRMEDKEESKNVEKAIVSLGDVTVGLLIATLHETQAPAIYCQAVRILGKIANSSAVKGLIAEMQAVSINPKFGHMRPGPLEYIAIALGRTRDKRAADPIYSILEHPEAGVGAALALAEIGDVRALQRLMTLAQSKGTIVPDVITALRSLLERYAAEMSPEDLNRILSVKNTSYRCVVREGVCNLPTEYEERRVDFADIRQLARQELARRERPTSPVPADTQPDPIRLRCRCGRKYRTKPEYAGRRIKCGNCGEMIEIPRA